MNKNNQNLEACYRCKKHLRYNGFRICYVCYKKMSDAAYALSSYIDSKKESNGYATKI